MNQTYHSGNRSHGGNASVEYSGGPFSGGRPFFQGPFSRVQMAVRAARAVSQSVTNRGCGLTVLVLAMLTIGCNATSQRQNTIGRAAFERGDHGQAINSFQQALNRDPTDSDAYYNLAACYYKLGVEKQNKQYVAQSEQLYRQAIAHNDQHIDAHRGLAAMLIETGREKYAFDLLDGWRQRYPQSPEPLIEIARLYQEYGDNRRATDLLADALRNDSRNVRALKAMGNVREIQGENQLALENYLRALQVDGGDRDTAARVAYLQTQINTSGQPAGSAPRYGAAQPYLTR